MKTFSALLRSLRPEQWLKNGFVLAPLVFSGLVTDLSAWLLSCEAVLAFCCAASATYLLNDVLDRTADRAHPTKRHRPIASGALPVGWALGGVLVLLALMVVLSLRLGHWFTLVVVGYLMLTVMYSVVLKRLVFIDVLLVAVGFLLRVVGGAVAIEVQVSRWLLLCSYLLALYLALGKRRTELTLLGENANAHRQVLGQYSRELVDQAISVVLGATIVAYSLYTVAPDTVAKVGSEGLMITVPVVLYGLLRYLYLLHVTDSGESQTKTLVSDLPLLLCVGVWMLTAAIIVKLGLGT